MKKRIFAYTNNVELSKAQLKMLADEGFIPIKVAEMRDIQVVESFPLTDETWAL